MCLFYFISHTALLASYSIMYELYYGVGEKTTDKPIRQLIYSLIQQMFTALGTKKTDEYPFPVKLSFRWFWIMVLTLSLTHCVIWVSNFIFWGLSFPKYEMINLGRVMSKGPSPNL